MLLRSGHNRTRINPSSLYVPFLFHLTHLSGLLTPNTSVAIRETKKVVMVVSFDNEYVTSAGYRFPPCD
jgi:hypothetical protein